MVTRSDVTGEQRGGGRLMSDIDGVRVEVHPMSALFPPEEKRWRVMIGNLQHSTHPTEEEAEATAEDLRKRFADAKKRARTLQ